MGGGVVTTYTLQPADVPDGTTSTRRPYPFHVDPNGFVQRQDFWRGRVYRVIGFVSDPSRMDVDIHWDDAVEGDITRVVGMYVITTDTDSNWSTQVAAIAEVMVNHD